MTTPQLPSRYLVGALLGEGGSGRVYRVHDSVRDRDLVLKLVTPAEAAFLRREFDTLRQIRHENLIQVFDWGALPSGEAYYTMELIEGGDWGRRMGLPQPPDEVRRILTGLLRGLAHLHCHGEIHGDLKPGNILLGAGSVVKIADTGMSGSEGAAAGLSGTPGYAAPEVWEGAKADACSDLYSVGVMAYEALTGRHPFAGRTVREVVSGQLEGWVASPGAHGVRVPADLERVMMRAVERQPGLRQGSADEFMEGMGVQDRIGEILGGRLVGREKEIAAIEALLRSDKPGTPTLLYVIGEPGVGKTSLLEEFCSRGAGQDVRTMSIATAGLGAVEDQIGKFLSELPGRPTANKLPSTLGTLAEAVFEAADNAPLLIWGDPNSDDEQTIEGVVRPLARHLWALSVERQRRAKILLVLTRCGSAPAAESFERAIVLSPFSEQDSLIQICGLVGAAAVEISLLHRLHEISGGTPGVLRSALAYLVDRRLLVRSGGRWVFHEIEQVQTISIPTTESYRSIAFDRLDGSGQSILGGLALLADGAQPEELALFTGGQDAVTPVSTLEARGWIRLLRGRWRLASEAIRQVVLDRTAGAGQSRAALQLLTTTDGRLSREERADLKLRFQPAENALSEGHWAANHAAHRGDYRTAVTRFRACRAIALEMRDLERARSLSIALAEALHTLGRHEEALSPLVDDYVWGGPSVSGSAQREHLLGVIRKSLGDLPAARKHLLRAVSLAATGGRSRTWLRCNLDLAEIDWTHGNEIERGAAIDRIRTLIGDLPDAEDLREERAAAVYGLGAALIRTGRRDEARRILLDGLQRGCSDYSRMRITNALSTATMYLGEFTEALRWIDEAAMCAESVGAESFKPRIFSNRAGILYAMGRLRESVNQDTLSSQWARRLGNPLEYAAACSGMAVNLILLGRYDDAIDQASESRRAAERAGDVRFRGKGLELEALALLQAGDYTVVESRIHEAHALLAGFEYLDVRPRLDWHQARLAVISGDLTGGEALLRRAELALLVTGDREDLWGVQIELHRLAGTREDSAAHFQAIRDLINEAEKAGLLAVILSGAVAIAEISVHRRTQEPAVASLLESTLGLAEHAGMLEFSWQLSYRMGELAVLAGDKKQAGSRFSHALRILRDVTGNLRPHHGKTYLESPHVSSALRRMSAPI